MEGALALIEKIIEEHKQIMQGIQDIEQGVNDATALLKLDSAKEDFVPGRLEDQKQTLRKWQYSLEKIDEGLKAHFNFEETSLLTAFEKDGNRMFSSALRSLLDEHKGLTNRLAKLKGDITELADADLPREVWEGKAWGIRAYMTHTWKLLEAHAQSEHELLTKLRDELRKGGKH